MKGFNKKKSAYAASVRVGWFLALRHIRRTSIGTTSLIVFIMVLTFLNLVVVSGLLVGLISGSVSQFRQSYAGEVIITPAARREYIENSPALVSFLRAHPKVENISARYGINAEVLGTLTDLPAKGEKSNRVGARIVGIDVLEEEKVTGFSRFVQYGEPLIAGEDGYILIGANLIKKYSSFADVDIPGISLLDDVDIGSRVRVSIALVDGGAVSKDVIVKGIVKSKVDEISTRMFMTSSELKRMIPSNKEHFQAIAVNTDYAYAPVLVQEIEQFMGGYALRAQTFEDAIPSFLRDVETTMAVLGNALSSIALVVASITIFIVIFINAVTKRKYIGIMKGIGVSPSAIQLSYVLQAIFYGLGGSIIGLALTFGFLKPYFAAFPIDFPFSDGILVADWQGASIRVGILLAVTLLAGYIPAKLIIRKNTLDAILGR